jgi:hypothetical protein
MPAHLSIFLILVLSLSVSAQRPARPARAPERSKPLDEVSEAHPRLGPPRRLLVPGFKWQLQSGAWTADAEAAKVKCTSDGTLAEYAAASGLTLTSHWLMLNATLEGADAKAGIWFAGVRDAKGEVLRITLDAAAGGLTGTRGQPIASLPDTSFAAPLELVLNFAADKVTVHQGGKQIAEIAITFDEPQCTPSLFVERGTATFNELLLSGEPAPAEPARVAQRPAPANPVPLAVPLDPAAPAVPARPATPAAAPAAAAPAWTFDFLPEKMSVLKSGWNDYFGIHFETAPGPWKMVRQYDGPEFGIPSTDKHTGDVKQFPGPFSEVPVNVSLADFRDWRRKDAKGLDENLAALVKGDRQGLFILPWSGPIRKVEQDTIYALMKITYGAIPGTEGHLYFQLGDGLNDGHYGTVTSARHIASQPSNGTRLARGANTQNDLVDCAEKYLAPAIEAIRAASTEIYKDPRRIPIVAGSCATAGEPDCRAWYGQLFDRELDGSVATSLKGRRLASLVDYLTVDYPFANAENDAALQEIWDRFCAPAQPAPAAGQAFPDDKKTRPRGLWVTEEYGLGSYGPATMTARAARFLAWAARNDLDAQQTRLLWNFPPRVRGSEDALAAARTLGETLGTGPLRVASQDFGDGRLHRILSGDGRMLLVYQPATVRRGKRPVPIGEIALNVADAQAAKPWVARVFLDTGRRAGAADNAAAIPVRRDGNRLFVSITANSQETWSLLLETP